MHHTVQIPSFHKDVLPSMMIAAQIFYNHFVWKYTRDIES